MFKVLCCIFLFGITQITCSSDLNDSNDSKQTLPVVMWHGMGDTAGLTFSLLSFKTFLEDLLGPDTYVKSIRIGKNDAEDLRSTYFVHPNKQVEMVCKMIAEDPKLKDGYNAVGFSQGAQFIRAVAQRCPEPRINNLISLGGQHQGVYGLPNCPSLNVAVCDWIRKILNYAAYSKYAQKLLVQATYWHNPLKEDKYREASTFIAEINNEHVINQAYVDNLKKLNKFVLVKFLNDEMVQPIDSSWFQFYTPNQAKEIQAFAESNAAKNLGLNDLVAENKIVFLETEGKHLKFDNEWFKEAVLPYLKDQN